MGDLPQDAASAPPAQGFAPNAVHAVRTVQQINVTLSQMADQKASILMGATFVVFTISIGQARSGGFALPLVVLAFFSFVSAMLAVFAVLPKIDTTHPADPNILFFGTFTGMTEQDFADGVIGTLHDEEAMYRLMLRDVYQNGQVLQNKKYRYLGLAYRTFLIGLMLTFVSFVITYLLHPG